MLKAEPLALWQEIESAIRCRDSWLSGLDDDLKRYRGDTPRDGDNSWPENVAAEYASLTTPRLVYNNPKVKVTTRRPGEQQMISQAIGLGLNRWVKDSHWAEKHGDRLAYDAQFAFGVSMVYPSPQPGYDGSRDVPHRPSVHRISPRRFCLDPLALWWGESRYFAHMMVRDKDDLEIEAQANPMSGWNAAEIRKGAGRNSEFGNNSEDAPDRGEITYWEVWVPEINLPGTPGPDGGYNGTIFTVSQHHTSAFLRAPRPFYGPRWGPYSMYGIYVVPDRPYPLSPLRIARKQIEDLNALGRSLTTSSMAYKKIALYDAKNPDLGEALTNTPHLFCIPVQGLAKDQVIEIEMGGITPQMLEQHLVHRQRMDRTLGLTEAQKGNTRTGATATADNIADEASTTRMSYIRSKFQQGAQHELQTVAWYLYHDDRVVFPLGPQEANQLQMVNPYFHGGIHDTKIGATFEDLELEIEPYSMERTSEATVMAKTQMLVEMTIAAAPLIPQTPFVDWSLLFRKVGDAANDPDFAKVVNPQLAQAMMGIPPIPGDEQKPKPMLGTQAGAIHGGGPPSGGNPNRGGHGTQQPQQNGVMQRA